MLALECLEDRLVLTAAPPIVIDGNFDDWDTAVYAGGTDPAGDPHDTDHDQVDDVPALVNHPDVDLLEYRVTHDAENLYFYFRAAGEIGRTQDSSGGGEAGRYYVIVTIDIDNDVNTGYPLHEGGYYPTTDGYDMNAEIEFYDGEFNTGHYLNHGALNEDELNQAFLDQTSGEYVEGNDGPYTPGFVNILPGTYDHYSQWVYQDNGTETDTDDQIILVRDKGPVVPGIVSYALSADGHELEMRAPLKGFLVDPSGTPIINPSRIMNLSFSLEASGELADGQWASDTGDPILNYSMYYNAPPMVTLANTITDLTEDTDTTSRVKVADIVIDDDGEGTNELSLTGADADLFEIDGNELFLKAGTVLDRIGNPVLDVTVNVDDTTVGSTPDDSASLAISVIEQNDAPLVALENTVTSLPEDTDTTSRVKVADIVITDDGNGTNVLSLTGADAALFEIVGSELFLKANTFLDHESQPVLSVIVNVDDPAVGSMPDDSAALMIAVSNVNEPPIVGLGNAVTTLPENTDTTFRIKVADIAVSDDGLGTNVLSLTGADAALFEIIGTELFLKAGAVLDSDTNPILSVTVNVDDVTVGTTPDGTVSLVIVVTPFINTRPVADAGGPYVLGVRDRIQLDGSGSYDVDQPADTLSYFWDYDNDGKYDAVGVRPYFTAADLNGQSNAVVRLKVVDDEGAYRTDVVRVYGEDTAVLRIRGDNKGVVGQRLVVSLKLYGPTVTHEEYTYTVDWGDGSTPRVVSGISGLHISKRYSQPGNYTVRATAVSNETGLVTTHTRVMRIRTILQDGKDFAVTGTNGDDYFRVFTRPGTDQVEIFRNRVSLGVHTVPGTVYVMGKGGDDWFVGDEGTYNVYFDGGHGYNVSYTYGGDDTIRGGNGRERFYDYGGNNDINAGDGHNRVMTGNGNDDIRSGNGDDKIIDTGGNNRINAGSGRNIIDTRGGNDIITTGSGQDKVNDLGGNNRIDVGDGSNVVRTGNGNDTIFGGAHDDSVRDAGGLNYIYTFAGNDFIVAYGSSYIDSGLGHDFVYAFNRLDDDDDLFDLLARSR